MFFYPAILGEVLVIVSTKVMISGVNLFLKWMNRIKFFLKDAVGIYHFC